MHFIKRFHGVLLRKINMFVLNLKHIIINREIPSSFGFECIHVFPNKYMYIIKKIHGFLLRKVCIEMKTSGKE